MEGGEYSVNNLLSHIQNIEGYASVQETDIIDWSTQVDHGKQF